MDSYNVFEVHLHRSVCQCFLPLCGQATFHCVYRPHFVYRLSVDGHLRRFHLLALVTSAAVNMCVQVFESLLSILPGISLEWNCWAPMAILRIYSLKNLLNAGSFSFSWKQ